MIFALLVVAAVNRMIFALFKKLQRFYRRIVHPGRVYEQYFDVIEDFGKLESEKVPVRKSVVSLARNVIIGLLFISAGCIVLLVVNTQGQKGSSDKLKWMLAPILFSIGLCFLLNVVLNSSPKGVLFLSKTNIYFRKNTLKILQILLGLMYIPITTSIMSMFLCAKVTCSSGSRIFKYFNNLDIFEMMSPKTIQETCETCNFANTCPLSLQQDLCPGETESLLIKDLTLSCTNEIYQFFYPSMILLLLIATIGIPILYFKIVNVISRILKTVPVNKTDEDKAWEERTKLSHNSSKTMYNAFESKWKYYKIVLIFYRLLVVLSFTFFDTLNLTQNAGISLCVVHFIAFAFSLVSRPYINNSEDQTFICTILLNLSNAIVIAFGAFDSNSIPSWLVYPMAILNVIVPASILIFAYYTKRKDLKYKVHPNTADSENTASPAKHSLKALDANIERKILKMVVNYFLAFGIIATITMALGSIGMYTERSASKLDMDNRLDVNDLQNWFTTWDDFTNNCCCSLSDSYFNTTEKNVYEIWQCRNKPFAYKVSEY